MRNIKETLTTGVDEIKQIIEVSSNHSNENISELSATPFNNGSCIFLYRAITGLTQKRLSDETNISRDLIRRHELDSKELTSEQKRILRKHLEKQTNSKAIHKALTLIDSKDWLSWVVTQVGKKPKIPDIKCTNCGSHKITFTTARKTCSLVRTMCEKCNAKRYSTNQQMIRTELWRTSEVIDPYDPSLFRNRKEQIEETLFIGETAILLDAPTLIAFRALNNLTQTQLAQVTDLSLDIIKRCENGNRTLDFTIKNAMKLHLKTNPEALTKFEIIGKLDKRILKEITNKTSSKASIKNEIMNKLSEI